MQAQQPRGPLQGRQGAAHRPWCPVGQLSQRARFRFRCGAMTEKSTGDLSRSFVGGTMQQVDDGLKAKDGRLIVFIAADWENIALDLKNFIISKNNTIPVKVVVRENLLMCSCVIVMQGKQCGPLHLALVAHCREWLWSKTTPTMSRRMVEGSGLVDYLQIMWCIDADFKLYRNVTSNHGMCQHRAESGGFWDGTRVQAHAQAHMPPLPVRAPEAATCPPVTPTLRRLHVPPASLPTH